MLTISCGHQASKWRAAALPFGMDVCCFQSGVDEPQRCCCRFVNWCRAGGDCNGQRRRWPPSGVARCNQRMAFVDHGVAIGVALFSEMVPDFAMDQALPMVEQHAAIAGARPSVASRAVLLSTSSCHRRWPVDAVGWRLCCALRSSSGCRCHHDGRLPGDTLATIGLLIQRRALRICGMPVALPIAMLDSLRIGDQRLAITMATTASPDTNGVNPAHWTIPGNLPSQVCSSYWALVRRR